MSTKTFSDWSQALHGILDDAQAVLKKGGDIDSVFADLKQFIVDSDDTINGVAELDAVARQAMRDLVTNAVADSVADMVSRSADVAGLEKTFSTQGASNNSIAAGLRLEKVRAVLDSSTQTIASLKALAETLPSATDKDAEKVAGQIEDVIDALTK